MYIFYKARSCLIFNMTHVEETYHKINKSIVTFFLQRRTNLNILKFVCTSIFLYFPVSFVASYLPRPLLRSFPKESCSKTCGRRKAEVKRVLRTTFHLVPIRLSTYCYKHISQRPTSTVLREPSPTCES